MNIFFTSDLHFSHEGILKHCNRPFNNVKEMDETIIENWNKKIPKKSTTYILGDVCWHKGPFRKYFHELNGKKVLIKGNHDALGAENLRLFTAVFDLYDLKINHKFITLCHYPMVSWRNSCHDSWHLYGHVHGRFKHQGLAMDVGVDTNNFFPYSYDEIKIFMVNRYRKIQEERKQKEIEREMFNDSKKEIIL